MLTLKIMSEQDIADDDPQKDYTLIQIQETERLTFRHVTDHPEFNTKVVAEISTNDGRSTEFPLTGNAYVMNANGKTIATRCSY
jgi:hypothetical protein